MCLEGGGGVGDGICGWCKYSWPFSLHFSLPKVPKYQKTRTIYDRGRETSRK